MLYSTSSPNILSASTCFDIRELTRQVHPIINVGHRLTSSTIFKTRALGATFRLPAPAFRCQRKSQNSCLQQHQFSMSQKPLSSGRKRSRSLAKINDGAREEMIPEPKSNPARQPIIRRQQTSPYSSHHLYLGFSMLAWIAAVLKPFQAWILTR